MPTKMKRITINDNLLYAREIHERYLEIVHNGVILTVYRRHTSYVLTLQRNCSVSKPYMKKYFHVAKEGVVVYELAKVLAGIYTHRSEEYCRGIGMKMYRQLPLQGQVLQVMEPAPALQGPPPLKLRVQAIRDHDTFPRAVCKSTGTFPVTREVSVKVKVTNVPLYIEWQHIIKVIARRPVCRR